MQPGAPTSRRPPHAVTSPRRGGRLGGPHGPAPQACPPRACPGASSSARSPVTTFPGRLRASRPRPRQWELHFPGWLAVRGLVCEVSVGCNFRKAPDYVSQEAVRHGEREPSKPGLPGRSLCGASRALGLRRCLPLSGGREVADSVLRRKPERGGRRPGPTMAANVSVSWPAGHTQASRSSGPLFPRACRGPLPGGPLRPLARLPPTPVSAPSGSCAVCLAQPCPTPWAPRCWGPGLWPVAPARGPLVRGASP